MTTVTPVIHWELNTTNIGLDSSPNHRNLTVEDVTLVTDSTRGPVALFGASGALTFIPTTTFISLSDPVTYTVWIKLSPSVNRRQIFTNRSNQFSFAATSNSGDVTWSLGRVGTFSGESWSGFFSSSIGPDAWHHVAVTFDGTTMIAYVDGVEIGTFTSTPRDNPFELVLGSRPSHGYFYEGGLMSDFRVYDTNLTVGEINTLIQEDAAPPPPEPGVSNVTVNFTEVTGATRYQLTYEGPSAGEITAVTDTTILEHNITGLLPDTAYTIKVYADTGAGYVLTEELTTTTLSNIAANYDVTEFQDGNGVTDLTILDITTLSNLVDVITELVNTGDVVRVSVEGNPALETSFVELTGNINLADVDGILLPFEVSSSAGQSIDLTLSDTTTVPVTYDEVNNTITVETVTYSDGDAIYLDGNKLQVVDYYGLTVVSVDVAPLLVEPGPINIPVVIAEVPGAVGYNVTYQSPTGGEITAFSGVTTLDQNITGLVSGTEYTIRLYADTGSGYVLTEELTTTTLANDAANYDVNIFVEDGVINLSSLPKDTISNIGEVMNELFNTGDVVNVSVQGKPGVNTSFIKVGDRLSIQELDGVLLPFVEASGTGQDVEVELSDGSTIVTIGYDETVNNIVVDGVVYYPGDSFILDGQKVTVVEY